MRDPSVSSPRFLASASARFASRAAIRTTSSPSPRPALGHEIDRPRVEGQRQARFAGLERAAQHGRPTLCHGRRLARLHGRSGDGGDNARAAGGLPLWPTPTPGWWRCRLIQRKQGSADVAWVKVDGANVLELDLPDHAHAEPIEARAIRRQISRLQDHHVPAAVAAAPL